MQKQVVVKIRKGWGRLRSDPWLAVKFASLTLVLGCIGKAMLIGAKDGAEIPKLYAQFVPTIPMMGLTFLAHRSLWNHRHISLLSYVGKHWSKMYATQFVAGHSMFILFAVWIGWHYLAVSVVIGMASAIVTFIWNEWKIFARGRRETE